MNRLGEDKRKGIRILVADSEVLIGDRLTSFLRSNGFEAHQAKSASDVLMMTANLQPHVILYDLMFPDLNAMNMLKQLKQATLLDEGKIKVFVMSSHNNPSNVKECMRLGAVDFLVKPLKPVEFLGRLVFQLQKKRELGDYSPTNAKDYESAQYFLYLLDMMMKESALERPVENLLHKVTTMMALAMKAVRVSVIRCDLENRRGEVLASNDNPNIRKLGLDLVKYPELVYALTKERLLALDNLASDPTMHFLTKKEKSISFHSMVVSPIRVNSSMWGVMSIRMPEAKERVSEYEIRFCQAAANLCSLLILRDAELRKLLVVPPVDAAS